MRDVPDGRTDFLGFVFAKGVGFERAVVEHLRSLGVGEVRTVGGEESPRGASRDLGLAVATWEAMVDGVAIIDQGVLRDPEHRTYGMPDLLVRSDVLAGLFPEALSCEDAAVAALALDIGDRHYVVVDIKYTTLDLTVRGEVANSGFSPAYKVQLHVYNRALGRLQGHCAPQMFLLGRGWKQIVGGTTTRGGSCMDRLGPVESDELIAGIPLSRLASDAAGWVRRMRRFGGSWDALASSVDELRPNAKRDAGVWASAVKHVLDEGRDLTVLGGVGVSQRREANARGLIDWRDERVTPGLFGMGDTRKARRLQALLDVNRTDGPAVRPAHIGAARSEWIDVPELEFYVDFETVSDIDDDFCAIPERGGQPLVFMVGRRRERREHGDIHFRTYSPPMGPGSCRASGGCGAKAAPGAFEAVAGGMPMPRKPSMRDNRCFTSSNPARCSRSDASNLSRSLSVDRCWCQMMASTASATVAIWVTVSASTP